MPKLQLKLANLSHFDEIWGTINESFQGIQAPYTTVGQPGYRNYLYDFLKTNQTGPKFIFVGLIENRVAAFADITLRSKGPDFLTRIAVRPEFRGLGLASTLMRQIQSAYSHEGKWELDVFHSNTGARIIYESAGFVVRSTSRWLTRSLPNNLATKDFEPEVAGENDAHYNKYGFSTGQIAGQQISVVGSAVRCHGYEQFSNDHFLMLVQKAYPNVERTFVVLDASHSFRSADPNISEIDRTYRMLGSF